MISIFELQGLIADSFFAGDVGIAGMVIFATVMAIIFALFGAENLMVSFALMLPITMIFTSLRILPDSMAILLVIVSVAGLAMTVRDRVV